MEMIYLGALTGLFLGSFGYTIIRFIVLPIYKYKRIKRNIKSDIRIYLNAIHNENQDPNLYENVNENVEKIKLRATELSDFYDNGLPLWYRLLLKRRGELPDEAAKHLNVLANTRNYEHAHVRSEKINDVLQID